MPYTVRSSERTRSSGADHETKALLYLMNFRSDSDEIHFFVVDFFNDLTGMDRFAESLWDVQSKGAKNNSPAAIGKELVTLFKNYLSDFNFKEYILFLGGVSPTVREDEAIGIFDLSKHIFPLPHIIKNQLSKIVDPVLFLQLFFVGQDKKDTSNISHAGFYNKADFYNMISASC